MAAIFGSLLFATLVLCLAPDAPAAVFLRQRVIQHALDRLAQMERHQVTFILLLVGLSMAGGEVFAMIGPEAVAASALDMAIYFDAVAVTLVVAVASRVRGAAQWSVQQFARLTPRPQAARRKRARRSPASARQPVNDDEHPTLMPRAA